MNKEIFGGKKGRTYWERTRVGDGAILEDKFALLDKKVILEIGPSETPYPIFGGKKMKKGEFYIGIDIDPNKLNETVNLMNLIGFPKEETEMVIGGVRKFTRRNRSIRDLKFPFRNQSVSEVIICNLVNDPRTMGKIGEILKDTARVLKPNGEIVVVQTRPYICPIEDLMMHMQKHSFELKNKEIHDRNKINQYRPSEGYDGEYIAKFSRPQPK